MYFRHPNYSPDRGAHLQTNDETMLIVGTGGFAMESMEILFQQGSADGVHFLNNVDPGFEFTIESLKQFPLIRNTEDLPAHFKTDPRFILGIGNPRHRRTLYNLLTAQGGTPFSLVSPKAVIGQIANTIEPGTNIMSGVVITSHVHVQRGALLNLNATIGHDSVIGEFSEICPGVTISGHCTIGNDVFIGSGATMLPGITIGEHAVVAAGAVLIRDVEPYTMVAGNPAIVKKQLR